MFRLGAADDSPRMINLLLHLLRLLPFLAGCLEERNLTAFLNEAIRKYKAVS
jgi:hypothetical protein